MNDRGHKEQECRGISVSCDLASINSRHCSDGGGVGQAEVGGAGVTANLEGERWAKLSVNCYVNALGGISVRLVF
eukprot:COSAG01_NODE_880_length_12937_cov_265.873968_4_plen_75_part_00